MAHQATLRAPLLRPTGAAASLERAQLGLLWLGGFAGAFVFMEPSPYELAMLAAMAIFAVSGLSLRAGHMPLVVLLVLYNLGISFALVPVIAAKDTLMWTLVSWYLAGTAIFFALIIAKAPLNRTKALLHGTTVAGVVAAFAGLVGYFKLVPGAEMFTRYERAQGTFNDPNVLGAFLILPACLLLHRVMTGALGPALRAMGLLTIVLAGIFLSFSRGAWGHLILSGGLVVVLTYVTSDSPAARRRIVALAVAGVVALIVLLLALLSIDKVQALFEQRFSLTQSYDEGHRGRFGRHILGAVMMLDHPMGLGPFQFGRYFPEAPHNVYLNAFVSGGWLAGLAYALLVVVTLVFTAPTVRRKGPLQPFAICTYATFVGVVLEGFIIDTDHWRHFYLLMGVLWGLRLAMPAQADPVQARRA
jgi:hypothetical protein